MRIGYLGAGKLGMSVALAAESKGHEVIVYDINPKIKDILRDKKLPYFEQGADELLKTSKIRFVEIPELVSFSDIIFVPIQTPHNPKFEGITTLPEERVDFDYSYLKAGIKTLSEEIEKQGIDKVVVIISTVLPGTIEREIKPLLGKHSKLAYNPYFIAMGTTIPDFLNPEFVLFGVDDKEAVEKAKEFYHSIHNRPFFETSIRNAEAIKVFYNTFISTKIGFANTIMEISHKLGCDCDEIYKALSLATDRIISPRYMQGGMGDSGGCFTPGTLVQTHRGAIPIDSIKIGDMVLTHDGQYHNVTETFKRWYEGDIIKITPHGFTGFPILATPDHPFWSAKRINAVKEGMIPTINKYDNYKRIDTRLPYMIDHTEFIFRPVEELDHGDVLALPTIKQTGSIIPEIEYQYHYGEAVKLLVTPDIMRLFGLFLAEGNTWKDDITFHLHSKETHLSNFLKDTFTNRFGLKTSVRVRRENSMQVRVSSSKLSKYLNNTFGELAWSKHIPITWINLPQEHLIELLRGMWYGDGSGRDTRYFYTTTSKELFNFNMLALLRLQIPFTTKLVRERRGKCDGVRHRACYYIRVSDIKKMSELLPELKCSHESIPRKTVWVEDGQMLYHIKSVERQQYSGYVYNLEVANTHSYCLVGAAVHNCHPRDNIALSFLAKKHEMSNDWFEEIMKARENQTEWLADIVQQYRGNRDIIILGIAYKPEINLTVGSASILLKNILESRGEKVITYDPYVNTEVIYHPEPALFFIGTKHKAFQSYSFPAGSVVIDPFRYIPEQAGVRVIGIGKPRRKHILVTGGAGYIGSVLIKRLKEANYRVTVVDNCLFGQDGQDIIKMDVRNFDYNLLNMVDVVVNLAALNLPLSKKYPDEAEAINHKAALELAKECEKRAIRFIFPSTCSNYGIRYDSMAKEEDELYPTSQYAMTKVAAEKNLMNINNVVILRFATAYGLSGQYRNDILLHDFINSAFYDKKIHLSGPTYYRPLCHVDDISSAIILAIERASNRTDVFNIGNTEHNFTKMDLANMVKNRINCEILVDDGIPDPRNYRVSFEKAKKELGFETKHNPVEAISEIYEALETNKLNKYLQKSIAENTII